MSARSTRSKQAPPAPIPPGGARTGGPRAAAKGETPAAPRSTDLDELEAPPIQGKVHPSAEISDAVPTLDDDVRNYRHHPNEPGSIGFDVDPYAADAAADLAGDLGSEFLEGATRGQDMSDVLMSQEDQEAELPFLQTDETIEGAPASEEQEPSRTSAQGASRRRPRERTKARRAR